MYLIQIETNGASTVIHEPGPSSVKVEQAQISREVSKFDSLTFTMYPDNPGWNEVREFVTLVTVTNVTSGKVVFDGRALQVEPDMDSDGTPSRAVTCEGVMGYLCDSQQPYEDEEHYSDTGGTSGLYLYVQKLLQRHNSTVEEHKRVYPGQITLQTFDTSGGVTKGISRGSTWDNINDKLLKVFGGEMRVRRADDGKLYLDYAESLGTTRATEVTVGRNMAEASGSPDPSSVITRLYPYGCKLKRQEKDPETGKTTEVETEERLTVESVNGGVAYIEDATAKGMYGIIEGYQEWDDVTQPTNLLSKAREWLGENNRVPVSYSITALDLSLIGLDYDTFELHDSYPCRNPLIGLEETLEIVKQTIDVSEPEASEIDFGEVARTLSADIGGSATKGDVEYVKSQIKTEITNAENRLVTNMSSLAVDVDAIVATVTQNVQQTVTEQIQQVEEGLQETVDAAQATADQAAQQAANAVGIASSKANVLIQSMSPGADYQNSLTLWIDTTDGANTPKRWDGTSWVAVTDKAAQDAANQAAQAAQAAQEAQQTADDAVEQAGTISQTVQSVNERVTNLEQTADGWSFNFTELQTTVTNIGEQVSSEYTERLKYIKFIDGEIWLGRDPDPGQDDFKVVISNQRIRFLQNNAEVAYLSNDRLFIQDGQILGNLEIGNFAWLPRSNGGMSLRKR